jgi:ubiquinone/menaquinone biosynthesis C-methylase UbiE
MMGVAKKHLLQNCYIINNKMPNIEENKVWGQGYEWINDGDEWKDQAHFSGQPYDSWKKSIIEFFILPNAKNSIVLEIAPGHGRWSDSIIKVARSVYLVDLNNECIDYCRRRFFNYANIYYNVNDGKSLPFILDHSIDFIWSYDSFVHMEEEVISSYFSEFARILKNYGKAIIHHSGGRNLPRGKGGWRSNVSRNKILEISQKNNLKVEYQIQSWGKKDEFNCKRFNDYISKILKS